MRITASEQKAQIVRALDGRENEFDVDALADDIRLQYGAVDIDTIPAREFWELVEGRAL